MRRLLHTDNLTRGSLIGGAVTLLSLPRMMEAGVPLAFYALAAFILMSIVGTAVCAWGAIDGMCRFRPRADRHPARIWLLALLAGSIGAIVVALWIDPLLREPLTYSQADRALDLRFPSSLRGRLALVAWAASFEALFLLAGPMAFFTRLAGRRQAGIVACVVLRLIVTSRQMDYVGIDGLLPFIAVTSGLEAIVGGWLFVHGGLLSVSLFTLVQQLHLWM